MLTLWIKTQLTRVRLLKEGLLLIVVFVLGLWIRKLMNKYQVYFHIESEKMYKSVHESVPVDDIVEISKLVSLLISENDSISIYTTHTKVRVQVWGDVDLQYCALEIHNPYEGVNFYKKFTKEEIATLSSASLEEYIAAPMQYGFDQESF